MKDNIKFFSKLSAEAKNGIEQHSQKIHIKSGKILCGVGTKAESIYFLLHGAMKVSCSTPDGKEAVIGLISSGDHVGLVALVSGTPRTTDIVAVTDCDLLKIEGEYFKSLLQNTPELSYQLLSSIACRLEETSRHLIQQSLLSVPHRIFARLLELSDNQNFDGENYLYVREIPAHHILASMVGATREAVSRALKTLETGGHIEIEEKSAKIISTPKL